MGYDKTIIRPFSAAMSKNFDLKNSPERKLF